MSTTSLPDCVQAGAASLAAEVGCGQDISCGCSISTFLAGLQQLIPQQCTDSTSALQQAQDFCVAANPHLLDNRRNTFIIPISIFMGLAIIVLGLRFYARYISKARLGTDDWLAVGALVFAVVTSSLELSGVVNGEGTHGFMVPLELQVRSNKTTLATGWMFTIGVLLLKLSILALYLRLFGAVRRFTLAVYGLGIFTIVTYLISLIVFTCQCKPVAYFWDRAIPGGECWNFQLVVVAIAGVDVITGIAILLLPVPVIWGLHMTTVKKVVVAGLFIIGGFTCIAGALRIPFILLIDIYDLFWTLVPFTIFTCLEVNLGVISVCLPALRPLFGQWWNRTGFSSQSKPFSASHTSSKSRKHRHSRLPDDHHYQLNNNKHSKDIHIYSGGDGDGSVIDDDGLGGDGLHGGIGGGGGGGGGFRSQKVNGVGNGNSVWTTTKSTPSDDNNNKPDDDDAYRRDRDGDAEGGGGWPMSAAAAGGAIGVVKEVDVHRAPMKKKGGDVDLDLEGQR